ncbi:MAG TPA: QueT transporter family protein [Candidatus Evtepia faecigallinarum]|nr:QueT transporter family protein [Candidatus Evtepia faecigallinarum]
MRSKTQLLALNGVIAAAYAALTLVASAMNLAYGPVQFRFSEALTVLPFLFPGTWPGVFVGCLVANLLSPYGPIDIIIGSLATLIAALLTQKTSHAWLAPLPPVVCNMVLVGGMLAWYEVGFSAQFPALFAVNAVWVGIGEAVVCYVLGILLLRAIPNVSYLRRYVPEERRSFRRAHSV